MIMIMIIMIMIMIIIIMIIIIIIILRWMTQKKVFQFLENNDLLDKIKFAYWDEWPKKKVFQFLENNDLLAIQIN